MRRLQRQPDPGVRVIVGDSRTRRRPAASTDGHQLDSVFGCIALLPSSNFMIPAGIVLARAKPHLSPESGSDADPRRTCRIDRKREVRERFR